MLPMQATNKETGESVTVLVETDCKFTFEGQTFESGGAAITPNFAIGYMSDDMTRVKSWYGQDLGSARVVASWKTPRSYVSSRYYQVECTISGVRYTGRTAGGGMLWKGKRKA